VRRRQDFYYEELPFHKRQSYLGRRVARQIRWGHRMILDKVAAAESIHVPGDDKWRVEHTSIRTAHAMEEQLLLARDTHGRMLIKVSLWGMCLRCACANVCV